MTRTVYGTWGQYECLIEIKETRRGPRWRYVIERHFVHTTVARTGRWRKTRDRAAADGSAVLDSYEPLRHRERGEWL